MIDLLKYYIKKRLHVIAIISSILIILALILFRDGYYYTINRNDVEIMRSQNNPIGYYAVFSSIILLVVPMFEFSFKMRKISVDEFYKFPIKKEKLYLVKFIIGYLEVIIPMTIFFLYTLLDISLSKHVFELNQYFIFYLLSIPFIFSAYSIISFIYCKCNTVYDGIINVVLVQFFFMAIAYVIGEILSNRDYCDSLNLSYFTCNNYWLYFFIYSPITRLAVYYSSFMEGNDTLQNVIQLNSNEYIATIISMIFFFILGIISVILLITLLKYEKSENSMDISNSWFSYKVMLPTFIIVLSSIITTDAGAIFLILVIIPAYIGYAIYRRNFKLKICDVVTIVSSIIAGLTMGAIIW